MKKDHRLLKVIDGKRRLAFDLPGEKELPNHLRKEAQRLGAQIDSEALRLLIDIVGPDAIALEGELDKLATYAAGEPIDAEMVEALAFRGDGVSVFALTDAVAARGSGAPRSACSSGRSTRGRSPTRCCRWSPARSTCCGRRGASSTPAARRPRWRGGSACTSSARRRR